MTVNVTKKKYEKTIFDKETKKICAIVEKEERKLRFFYNGN